MSTTSTEFFLRHAREQVSQRDINDSLVKAVSELTREVKRLENELRRARRAIDVLKRQ